MRYRRFEQQHGTYDDLLDIPRHLSALGRYDDIADLAAQATQILPGTLATVACLAEIRPLIPPTERAWAVVADLEALALLSAGDLPAATRQLHAMHQQIQARAAADPANTQWQRDLSVSHNKLGDVAVAAGDLAAARTAYQASLDIAARLAAADPANTRMAARPVHQPRPAGGCSESGRGPGRRPRRLPGRPGHPYPAGRRRPRQHRMAARPVGQPQQAGGCGGGGRGPGRRPRRLPGQPGHRRAAGRRRPRQHANGSVTCRSATTSWGMWRWRPGTWPRPAPPTRPAWTSAPGWPPPTPPTPAGSATCRSATNKLGNVAVAAGDLTAARAAYQASLDIRTRLAAADPANTQLAARPVGQPQQAGGCGGGGRGPGRRPRRLPGQPGHRRPAGRRRPRQHRNGSATCPSATTSWGMWRWRPGT